MDKETFEVIVVSDGPDEETEELVAAFCRAGIAIRYFSLDEKKGPAAARNLGWLNARGKIVAFTDDDCMPDKSWLPEIEKSLEPDSLQAITGRVIVPLGMRPTDYARNTAALETADFITANCACTKEALFRAGGFDERFGTAWREDSDLEFKLLTENIPVRRVASAIVTHPVRQAKWGISLKEQKKTLYNALLYKKYPQLYRQKIQPRPPVLYYAIVAAFVVMLAGAITGNRDVAIFGLMVWVAMNMEFMMERLRRTARTPQHIAEMIATSLVIPFLSIYWQWYGAVKYKVLFF